MKDVCFTHHALRRARERKLWKYVSKAKFYFEAIHKSPGQAILGDCVYVYKYEEEKTYIITMMRSDRV